jgi:hypothetical protein
LISSFVVKKIWAALIIVLAVLISYAPAAGNGSPSSSSMKSSKKSASAEKSTGTESAAESSGTPSSKKSSHEKEQH